LRSPDGLNGRRNPRFVVFRRVWAHIVLSRPYLDRLVRADGRPLFRERRCICDTLLIPTSLAAAV
jgi:hypothetical protein